MPALSAYNLFISHSWSYSDAYKNLEKLLKQASYFEYHDYSVPKDDPIHTSSDEILRNAIHEKFKHCNCILVLAGVYASYSRWIDIEMSIAKHGFLYPKPIIAIEPWGAERTSAVVKNNAKVVVAWNTNSIVKDIREYSL